LRPLEEFADDTTDRVSRCFGMTLLLRKNTALVERYEACHRHVWPEVVARLREVGVLEMQIFLLGRRLFLWIETVDSFNPQSAFARLGEDERYREWDELSGRCKNLCRRRPPANGGRQCGSSLTSTGTPTPTTPETPSPIPSTEHASDLLPSGSTG
jgi:L-rhamnose mutarotase